MLVQAYQCFSQDYVTTKNKCYRLKPYRMDLLYSGITFGESKAGTIPKGVRMKVINRDTIGYILYLVEYKNKQYWVARHHLVEGDELLKLDPEIREEYLPVVLDHSVAIGMTKHELIQSIGEPMDKKRTITKYGTSETLTFGTVINHYYAVGFQLRTWEQKTTTLTVMLKDDIVEAIVDY